MEKKAKGRGKESIKNSLGQSHEIMARMVREGDTVVDATAGNGNDTVLLAQLAGPAGKVFSFDIQEKALEKTREKLQAAGLESRVTLILDGHQNMDRYIQEPVRMIMFNLGYLPGGDHSIGTRAPTTQEALEKAMKLLQVNGVISVVIYYGGDSGFEEKDALMDYIRQIDNRQFTVMKTEFVNQVNCPPILVCIEKLFE